MVREGPIRRLLKRVGKTESSLAEEKVEQWRWEGYSEQTIERGLAWAEEWAWGTAQTVTDKPELQEKIVAELLPKAFNLADEYLRKLTEAIKREGR